MKRAIFAALIVSIAWAAVVLGQGGTSNGNNFPGQILTGSGAPSGSCGANAIYVDNSGGNFYVCKSGSWSQVSGAGGAVNSVSGDGTLITNNSSSGSVTLTVGNFLAHHWWGNNTGSTAAAGSQQPACADLSNSVASCSTDATNATNISSGTLAAARLPAALSSSTSVNGTSIPASGTLTQTICSGTIALGTTAIGSGAKSTVATSTCTGLATTDNIEMDFNADPSAVTGYAPSANGTLTLVKFPTSNTINVYQYNDTSASITPGSMTVNYRVVR